jgi:hypothetical protein
MTVERAMEILDPTHREHYDSIDVVNEACRMGREALKKQIPKKPIKRNPIIYRITKDGQKTYAYQHFCPLCDTKLKFTDHHCPCGQAIDWSDAE